MSAIRASQIEEHMPVLGSDGGPIGTVDRVEGRRITLTLCGEWTGSGRHHVLPLDAVASCDGGQVRLTMPAEQARQQILRGAMEPDRRSPGMER